MIVITKLTYPRRKSWRGCLLHYNSSIILLYTRGETYRDFSQLNFDNHSISYYSL